MTRNEVTVTIAFGLLVACLAGFVATHEMSTTNWLIAGGLAAAGLLLLLPAGKPEPGSISPARPSPLSGASGMPSALRQWLSKIGAALPDPVLVLDNDGIVIFSNDHARALLEVEPTGRHVSMSIRAPSILEAIAEATSARKPSLVDYEVRIPVERRFEAHIAPIDLGERHDHRDTGWASVIVVLRDFSRAYHVERMRADFIANASHELRTPLASVLGFIETLQGPARNDEAARTRFLDLMHNQGTRMSRLIDDLLSLSRIEMNVHVKPTADVNIGDTVRHVIDLLQPIAADRQIELVVHADPQVTCLVRGDRDELVQVFQNLIENAIKYSGDGKRVDIGIEKTETASIEVTVRDYGPGIDEEHLPRLTERFYRVSTQDSRARGGTGLGLAITKHILNRHRGKLVIRSKLGEGSSFIARLPASNGQ